MDKLFKRKKQETETNDDEEDDLEEGVDIPLLPKRTKVQAQRKFAQGSSPMVTPVKETPVEVETTPVVPSPPVFTQPPVNQPKTEDFLTYLCFRGTSLVSRRLSDMFSTPSPVMHNSADQKTAKKIRKKRLTEEDLKSKGKFSRQKMPAAQLKKLKQQDQTRMRGVQSQQSADTKTPMSRKQQQLDKLKNKNIPVAKKSGIPGRKPKQIGVLRKAQMTQRERLKSRLVTSSVASNRSGLRSSGILSSSSCMEEGLPPRKQHRHLTLGSTGTRKGAVLSKHAVLHRNKHSVKDVPSESKTRLTTRQKTSEDSPSPIPARTSIVPSARLPRKSKEAAAVYMDLLGEEVKNPEAFDQDDNSSVESFPELPKARTIERREKQIREMAAAQKQKTENKTLGSRLSGQAKSLGPRIASNKLTVQSLLKKRMTRSTLKLKKQPTGKDEILDKRKTRAKLRDEVNTNKIDESSKVDGKSKIETKEPKAKIKEESEVPSGRPSRSSKIVQNKSNERNESPKMGRSRGDFSPVVAIDELSPGKLAKIITGIDGSSEDADSFDEKEIKSKNKAADSVEDSTGRKKTRTNSLEEKKTGRDEEQSKTEEKITRTTRSNAKASEDNSEKSEAKAKRDRGGSKVNEEENKKESQGMKDDKKDKIEVNTNNSDTKSKNETEEKSSTKKKKVKPGAKQKINFDEIVRDETFVSKNRAAKCSSDGKGKPESQGKAKKKKDIDENNVTIFVTKVDVEKVVDSGSPLKPRETSVKPSTGDSTEKSPAVKAIRFEIKEPVVTLSKELPLLPISKKPLTPEIAKPPCSSQQASPATKPVNDQTKETKKASIETSIAPPVTISQTMKSSEKVNNVSVGESKELKQQEVSKTQTVKVNAPNNVKVNVQNNAKVNSQDNVKVNLQNNVKVNSQGNVKVNLENNVNVNLQNNVKVNSQDTVKKLDQNTVEMTKIVNSTVKLIPEAKTSIPSRSSNSNKVREDPKPPEAPSTSTDTLINASTKVKRVQLTPSKLVSQPNTPTPATNTKKPILPEEKTLNSKDNLPQTSSSILSVNSNSTLKPRSRATVFVKGAESPMTQIADNFRLNFEKKDPKQVNKKEAVSKSTIAELDKELSNFVKDIVKSDWEGKTFDIPLTKPMRDGSKARKQIATIDFINSTPVKCSSNEELNIRNDKVIISPLRKLTDNEIRILLAQESPMKLNEKSPEVFNHTMENLSRAKVAEPEDSVSKLCIEKITNEIISLIDPKMNLAETQDIIKKYNLSKQLHSRPDEKQVTTSSHKPDPSVSNKPSYSHQTDVSVSSKPSFSHKPDPVSSMKPSNMSSLTSSHKGESLSSLKSSSGLTPPTHKGHLLPSVKAMYSPLSVPKSMESSSQQSSQLPKAMEKLNFSAPSDNPLSNQRTEKPVFPTNPSSPYKGHSSAVPGMNKSSSPFSAKEKTLPSNQKSDHEGTAEIARTPQRNLWPHRGEKHSILAHKKPGTLDKQYRLSNAGPVSCDNEPLNAAKSLVLPPQRSDKPITSSKSDKLSLLPSPRQGTIDKQYRLTPHDVTGSSSVANARPSPQQRIPDQSNPINLSSQLHSSPVQTTLLNLSQKPSSSPSDVRTRNLNKSFEIKNTAPKMRTVDTKLTSMCTKNRTLSPMSNDVSIEKYVDAKSSSPSTFSNQKPRGVSINKPVDSKSNSPLLHCNQKSSGNSSNKSVDSKTCPKVDQKSSNLAEKKVETKPTLTGKSVDTQSRNSSMNTTAPNCVKGTTNSKITPNSLKPSETFSEVPILLSNTYQTIILDTKSTTPPQIAASKEASSEPLKPDSKCANNVQKPDCDKSTLSRVRRKSVVEDDNTIAEFIKEKIPDAKENSRNPPERQIIKAFEDKYEPKSSPTKNIRKYSNLGKKSPGKQTAKQDRNITKSLRTKKDTLYLEDYSSTDTSEDDGTSRTSVKTKKPPPTPTPVAGKHKEKALSDFSSDSDVEDMIEKIRTDERKKPKLKSDDTKKSEKKSTKESSIPEKSDLKKSKKEIPERKEVQKSKKEELATGDRRLRNKQSVLYNLESLETDSDTADEEIIPMKKKSEEQSTKRKNKKSSASENEELDEKECKNKKVKTEDVKAKKRGRKKKQKEQEESEVGQESIKNNDRDEDGPKETSDCDSDVKKKKTLKKRSKKQCKQIEESSESEKDEPKVKEKKMRKKNEGTKKEVQEDLQSEDCGTRKNLRRNTCHLYAENLSSNSEDDLELLIQNRSDEIETQNLINHPRKSKKLLAQVFAKNIKLAKEKSKETRMWSDSETSSGEDSKSKQSKGKKSDKCKVPKTLKKPAAKHTKQSDKSASDSEKSSKKQEEIPKKDSRSSKKANEKGDSQEEEMDKKPRRTSKSQSLMIDTSDSEDDPLLAIAKTISLNAVRMSRRSIDLLHAKEKEILKKNETSEEESEESENEEEKEVKKIRKASDVSVSKRIKEAENIEEVLKPVALSKKSSQCSSQDVSNKISCLIEKDKQKRGLDESNDRDKTSALQQEAIQRLEKPFTATPEKKPMSREQLHSSWKSAFQNLKLPKTSPSVSKTPMDRNAWIKKHALLAKPKLNETRAPFEPFKINYSRSSSPMSLSSHNSDSLPTPVEGKHHNLPMPVEQTLKRMANISPKVNKSFHFEQKVVPPPPPSKIEDIPKAGNFNESIIKWLNDSIPNDDSSCDDTNSTSKKLNSRYGDDTDTSVTSSVIDKGIVSAPVQLKDIFSSPVSFTSEKISSVKVDDYRKLKQKSVFTSPSLERKRYEETPDKRKLESETDSLVSDLSSCDENKPEKKAIFQQRRSLAERLKERQTQSSKAKIAFSPQNESSVYAFEAEPAEALPSTPFRRGTSKNATPPSLSKPGSPVNSSIAVQVNFESETVLECSTTQTELSGSQADDGHLFYIPLQKNGQDASSAIQGVAVKLGTEGPDQRVIMSAKLVTKPPDSSDFAKPSSVSCLVPQRRVRPFNTPIVGTVQPMSRPTTGTQVSPRSQHTQTPPPPPKPSASSTTSSSSTSTVTTKSEKKGKSKSSTTGSSCTNKKRRSPSPEPCTSSLTSPSVSSANNPCGTAVKHKTFPSKGSRALMVEAPTFHPTEKEFQDPFDYIEKIRPSAEQFGICRIVPPSSFKPECKLNDDMRFTAYNQYVHKMLYRWGPNVKEMVAIRKYLATQSVTMQQLPVIGGIEVDLPRLYSTVQQCGGLSEVIEKKRWSRVADLMRIPRLAQDRISKLDDIYCKYLLPYDTLSHDERTKLFDAVEAEWGTHFNSSLEDEEDEEEEDNNDDELDECIVKGRSIPLSTFYRIARNTLAMYFKSDNPNDPGSNPSPGEVESEFWTHVTQRMLHVCVHSASIDTGSNGCGFPTMKNSTFAKHPWNLKVLTNNSSSILRALNNVVGVTVPTLHVGMLFSACCWYRDPHGLPWIEYLHSGACKIWYGIPDEHSTAFRSTMMSLFPHYCHSDRTIWLSSDVAMVPPSLLTEKGVSLSRVVQEPGQFVVVFPSAFTSSIATGYLVAESVYFARPSWLNTCERVFKDMQDSSEPAEFSLELLLFAIAADSKSSVEVLNKVLPMIESIRLQELSQRSQLTEMGVKKHERICTTSKKGLGRKKATVSEEDEEHECDVCRVHLPISMVQSSEANDDEEDEVVDYCLNHGIEHLNQNMDQVKHCKVLYYYDEAELGEIISKLKDRIKTKSLKKLSDKHP